MTGTGLPESPGLAQGIDLVSIPISLVPILPIYHLLSLLALLLYGVSLKGFFSVTSITSIVKQLVLGNPGSVQPYKCLSQWHGPTSLIGPAPLQRCPLSIGGPHGYVGRYVRFGLSFLTELSISPAFKPNRILISIPVSRSHGSRTPYVLKHYLECWILSPGSVNSYPCLSHKGDISPALLGARVAKQKSRADTPQLSHSMADWPISHDDLR